MYLSRRVVPRTQNSKKESNDLAKVFLESNQKSSELSMNRKYGHLVISDDRKTFTKVLGADKGKVYYKRTTLLSKKTATMIILHFHLQPQFQYEFDIISLLTGDMNSIN